MEISKRSGRRRLNALFCVHLRSSSSLVVGHDDVRLSDLALCGPLYPIAQERVCLDKWWIVERLLQVEAAAEAAADEEAGGGRNPSTRYVLFAWSFAAIRGGSLKLLCCEDGTAAAEARREKEWGRRMRSKGHWLFCNGLRRD